jgi:hypothetical protein
MKIKAITTGVIAAFLGTVIALPAHAAVKVGTLGAISFTQTGTTLTSSASKSLASWTNTVKQAAAIRLDAYGGNKLVTKSLAQSRAAARAKAVRHWLVSRSLGGTITIVNKTWWTAKAGADKGNRVVIVITKLAAAVVPKPTTKSLTVHVTSDFDPPQSGDPVACNFTATSVAVQQASATVVSTSVASADGTCGQTFTLNQIPIGKSSNFIVSFACNVSGDGMPAEDVCFYAQANVPWDSPVPSTTSIDPTGQVTLTGVMVTGSTGSVAELKLTVNPL